MKDSIVRVTFRKQTSGVGLVRWHCIETINTIEARPGVAVNGIEIGRLRNIVGLDVVLVDEVVLGEKPLAGPAAGD